MQLEQWLHCAMFVLVTSLCLVFSDADRPIELDFVLMTMHAVST